MRLDENFNLEANGYKIALDSRGSGCDCCFVSHAHSDHTSALRGKNKKILASDATLSLTGFDKQTLEEARLAGVKIELLPSGHMLGSRQIRVEHDSEIFTYTGDFKLSESLTAEPARVEQTDILMIEGTFGEPSTKFPERHEVYEQIAKFTKENYEKGNIVLLGGYTLGKAEELVSIVNKYCGLTPVVSEKIGAACDVYSSFGVRLDAAGIGSEKAEEIMKGNFVAVMPMHQVNFDLAVKLSRAHKRSVYSAVATGWAGSTRFQVDAAFPLSDHADFAEIMEYVERASPKKIYCCHGNEDILSRELRKRGFNASAVGETEVQLSLGEC